MKRFHRYPFILAFWGFVVFASSARAQLAKPVTWGSPDQPYGTRRPVTEADRAAILSYRSGTRKPIYATSFTDQSQMLADWNTVSDDNEDGDFESCRRPANAEASVAGLRLKTMIASDCHARWSTGYIAGKTQYSYGFYEVSMKIADLNGLNNAFWLTTVDNYEIDIAEIHYPSYIHFALQYWPRSKTETHTGVGWGAYFKENFSYGFHDVGILWTPRELVYEIDGEPIAAAVLHSSVKGSATVRLSTALLNSVGKIPAQPEGHNMTVRSLRIYAQ